MTSLAGGLADTSGGVGDTVEGVSGGGVGGWSGLVGGVTNVVAKGSGLMSTLAEYGRSALDYVSSFGYGTNYLSKLGEACTWLGGWAKSASDVLEPYAFYVDLIASGSKAAKGLSDGWKAGEALYDLADLVKRASSREMKKAAELLFNLAWWKRVEGYAKTAVGGIEGSAVLFFGPLSKGFATGLITAGTKSYESGWLSYLFRAIGSSFTSQIYSNAQVKQTARQQNDALMTSTIPIAQNGKVKDIVALCKAAIVLGMTDFARAIVTAFNTLATGSTSRHQQRKQAFVQELTRAGLAKQLGV